MKPLVAEVRVSGSRVPRVQKNREVPVKRSDQAFHGSHKLNQ